jgi:hypothetical protein
MKLKKEAYNLDGVADPLFIWDAVKNEYVELTRDHYNQINKQQLKI